MDKTIMEDESKEASIDKKQTRSFTLERDQLNTDTRTITISVSSEAPYQRHFGWEVLSHREGDVDLGFLNSGNAPVLADHDHKNQIGVVEKAWLESGRVRAIVRFSKNQRADEYYQDVVDGIRTNISVGYEITDMTKGEMRDGVDTYLCKFRPYEVSSVSVPADPEFSGTNRADSNVGVEGNGTEEFSSINKTKDTKNKPNNKDIKQMDTKETKNTEVKEQAVDLDAVRAEAQASERDRITEIRTISSKMGFETEAEDFVKSGASVTDFKDMVFEKWEAKTETQTVRNVAPAVHTKKHEFSLARALGAASTGMWDNAGLEREQSQEMAKQNGSSFRGNNFFISPDMTRDGEMSVGGASVGSHLVATEHRADRFIDLLYNETIAGQLGVDKLLGLQGNQSIPAWATGSSASWGSETAALVTTGLTTRDVTLAPKRLTNKVQFSRQLLIQSDPAVESRIRNDILTNVALTVDLALIAGAGGAEPTGIKNIAGIGSVDAASADPTFAMVKQVINKVATANALKANSKFLTNANGAYKFGTTVKDSNTAGIYLMNEDSNKLCGYDTVMSNLVPTVTPVSTKETDVIFGDWNSAMVGQWGALEIETDPYSAGDSAEIVCRCFSFWDIAVKYAESFAVLTNMTAE